MPEDVELERRVRKLTVEHAETRWLALRLDDDIKEVREVQREHTARLDAIDAKLQEHTARFDSVDSVLRPLHQLVGQVLDRLPEEPAS